MLARDLYGVTDPGVLHAVRFHTTLHGALWTRWSFWPTNWNGIREACCYPAELWRALGGGLTAGIQWVLGWMATLEARLLLPHPDLRAAWRHDGLTPP